MASWRRRQRGGRAETVRLRLDAASNNSILNAAPYNTGQNQRLLLPLFLVLPSASQLSSLGAIPRLFIGSCLCASPSAAPALGPPTRHPLTTYPLSAVAPRQHTHTHTHTQHLSTSLCFCRFIGRSPFAWPSAFGCLFQDRPSYCTPPPPPPPLTKRLEIVKVEPLVRSTRFHGVHHRGTGRFAMAASTTKPSESASWTSSDRGVNQPSTVFFTTPTNRRHGETAKIRNPSPRPIAFRSHLPPARNGDPWDRNAIAPAEKQKNEPKKNSQKRPTEQTEAKSNFSRLFLFGFAPAVRPAVRDESSKSHFPRPTVAK